MDKIQKVLIEQGRKDLAQQYYEKISKNIKKTASSSKKAFALKSINGLSSVSRTFTYLLVPMAKYVLTKYLEEDQPIIITSTSFDKRAGLIDVQIDVNKTEPVVDSITAFYSDKIITCHQHYEEFIVTVYTTSRETAKEWQDKFEHRLITKNQYRGKCLYAESGIVFKEIPDTNWDDVILTDKVKDDIRLNTVTFLGNEKLSSVGVTKRGLVMYGPPGTGKTSVVKAIFKELEGKNVSRIYVSSESFRRMSISNLFDTLKYLGSTILAFEDIDLISGSRDTISSASSGLLGDLLTNLDGMRKYNDPFVVMASTNKIDLLDSALADRPGRFDRKIEIGLPNDENLRKIYIKLVGSDVDDVLIKMSNQFTGSHVTEVVNTAKILAANEGKNVTDCLIEACSIVRDNFFPGQTTNQIRSAIKKNLKKIVK